MRIALLTAFAEHPDCKGKRLAFRRFLGRSVLTHQVDCALALGCEAIVCLAASVGREVLASQDRAEAGGARFHAVDGVARLHALVRADDQLVVFADGLLPDPDVVTEHLLERPGVLSFPAQAAIARGFERLDAVRAWAGVLRTRGDNVERLTELGPECDAASALLRIALQTGVRTVELDPGLLAEGRWDISGDIAQMPAREQRWIARQSAPVRFTAPGLAIAERMGVRIARDIVGTRAERVPLLVTVFSGIFAALAALAGRPLVGLCLAWPMMFALPVGAVVERVARFGWRKRAAVPLVRGLRWAADVLLAGLVALATPPQQPEWARLFVPVVLLGLLRLGERLKPRGAGHVHADRILLVSLLIPAAFLGVIQPAAAILALIVLGSLFLARAKTD